LKFESSCHRPHSDLSRTNSRRAIQLPEQAQ
jgi:hypothetical protein